MYIKVKNLSLTYPIRSAESLYLRKEFLSKLFKKNTNHNSDITSIKKIEALNRINFEIFDGDKLGIIGSNGSGKSTLISCLAGILEPDLGSIVDISGKVVPVIDPAGLAEPTDTVRNNIILAGQILSNNKEQILKNIDKILDFSELRKYQMVRYSNLSSGMKLKLIISIVLFIQTEILISDEFFVTGDERYQKKIFDFFEKNSSKKNISVICSHSRDIINNFCNKILVLDKGEQIYFGEVNKGFEVYNNLTKDKSKL
jgi:ABC-type polysaccharide/polyol phosphate transport system ATPase subunit